MAETWAQKAQRYIASHRDFSDVSEVFLSEKGFEIHAIANIELPSFYSHSEETALGVRNREPVHFVFDQNFPLEAPRIFLRDDFPRIFPHINPSSEKVTPCIYAGSLSELLQQPGWMNELLNQLIDWLFRAAADDLINLIQGWEPMRSDTVGGFIILDDSALERIAPEAAETLFTGVKAIACIDDMYFLGRSFVNNKASSVQHIFRSTPSVVSEYIPNQLYTVGSLDNYAKSIGIQDLGRSIQHAVGKGISDFAIAVTIGIRRPAKLINTSRTVEFISFLIHKDRRGKKYYVSDNSKISYIEQISESSPSLLRRLSGVKGPIDDQHSIAIIGCGSVGSKIALHLARNGNDRFVLVDKDVLYPHNNARHASFFCGLMNKADQISGIIKLIHPNAVATVSRSVYTANFRDSSLLIESTASLSVRAFFMRDVERPPLVSVALFDHGKTGLMMIETPKKVLLCDIWAYLYKYSMIDTNLERVLFASQTEEVFIGQSCRSSTLVVSDAAISLFAASFGMKIQKILEEGISQNGEVLIASLNENNGLTVNNLDIPEYVSLSAKQDETFSVRIEKSTIEMMRNISEQYVPNEIGGVLIGTIFQNANRVVITGLLEAPKDSQSSPGKFVLGVEGLEDDIREIEIKSHGRITYLGTWHSHPTAGGPSQTDRSTLERLESIREREPTICLICSPDGIHRV